MRTGTETGRALKFALMATAATAAIMAMTDGVSAGGFALREQSAEFQGMSFAGDAAGTSLGAMFWNPAAAANRNGLNTESSVAAVLANSKVTVTSVTHPLQATIDPAFNGASPQSGDIGPPGFLAASYGSYQLTKSIFLGMAVNAPFGLKSDPTNSSYQGSVIARKTELVTYNFNPTVAVRIAPGITIGAGAQIQSAEGIFRFATGTPVPFNFTGTPLASLTPLTGLTTKVEGNGWGFGGTAGIMIEASPTTRIGIGYRSQLDQQIDGHISTEGSPIPLSQGTEATLKLPDVVTVSFRQVVSPVLRLNGTFEWSNWSRFKDLTVTAASSGASALGPKAEGETIASLPLNWSDGYFISAGAEYDVYPTLTGRFGVGYEWSPVDSPEKRSTGFPDDNRVWLSAGFSWMFTPTTTIDFGYSHLFVDDSTFKRDTLGLGATVMGEVESKIDIVSVGVKTRW